MFTKKNLSVKKLVLVLVAIVSLMLLFCLGVQKANADEIENDTTADYSALDDSNTNAYDIDTNPDVKFDVEYCKILEIESEKSALFHPRTFAKKTLLEAFKKAAQLYKDDKPIWNRINEDKRICLRIVGFVQIASDSISQDIINEAIDYWDQYRFENTDVKIEIDSIYFDNGSSREVTFNGTDCIHDLPVCDRIEIYSGNLCHQCINNLPDLEDVTIRNKTVTWSFDSDKIKDAIKDPEEWCQFYVYRDDRFHAYELKHVWEYDGNNWTELEYLPDNLARNSWYEYDKNNGVCTIHVDSHASQIIYPQAVNRRTVTMAIKRAIYNCGKTKMLKCLNTDHSISFVFENFAYVSEAFSKNTINKSFKLLKAYQPLSGDVTVNVESISFTHADSKEVTFTQENCIHDLPGLKRVNIERVNWHSNCINNCPDLGKVYVENDAERYDPEQIDDALINNMDSCSCCIKTDVSESQHLKHTSDGWKETEVDLMPKFSYKNVNGNLQITITSSNLSEILLSQTFYFWTLEEVFKDMSMLKSKRDWFSPEIDVWDVLNKTHTVELVIDKYPYIRPGSISQTIINDIIKFWDNYKPINGIAALKVASINFISPADKEVTFAENGCIHDLPYCKIIDIERVNWHDNCINNCPDLEDIYVHNRSEGFDEKDLDNAIVDVKDECACIILRTFGKNLHYVYSEKKWTEPERYMDLYPSVKVNNIDNCIQFEMLSSSDSEIITPQSFGKWTLLEGFKKIAKEYKADTALWDRLNKAKTISIKVAKYPNILTGALNQDLINKAASYLDKYSSTSTEEALSVKSIYFTCASEKEVTFQGSDCVCNIPSCNLVDIERVNWTNCCINNMPNLNDIIVHNRSEGYSVEQIRSAISNVNKWALCKIYKGLFWKDQYFQYTDKWDEVDNSVDADPEVSFNGNTIMVKSSTDQTINPQTFSNITLRNAFKKANNIDNNDFWNTVNSKKSINLTINEYTNISSEAISQDQINFDVNYWTRYTPVTIDKKLTVSTIQFTCCGTREVTFKGQNCVHDLPDCTYIDIERVNWDKSCINNMPNLNDIIVHNRSEGYSVEQIRSAIKNVNKWCLCKIYKDLFWKDQYFQYTDKWDEVDNSVDVDPKVSLSGTTLVIESSENQTFKPQTFTNVTLRCAFKKANNIDNKDFWDRVSFNRCMGLSVNKYTNIGSEAISKEQINIDLDYWTKYTPVLPDKKLIIYSIHFTCSDTREVTFRGSNCVHDLPGCTYIEIERVNWDKCCINNMPNLGLIKNFNRSDTWEMSTISSAICNVPNGFKALNIMHWRTWDQEFTYDNNQWSYREI